MVNNAFRVGSIFKIEIIFKIHIYSERSDKFIVFKLYGFFFMSVYISVVRKSRVEVPIVFIDRQCILY